MSVYVQKYFEEIFEDMLEDSLEQGLISHAEEFDSYIQNRQDISNYYVMDKSVIALMMEKIYAAMTDVYNRIDIDIAEGVDLDNIGDFLGVTRPEATSAICEVTFTLDSYEETDVTISSGVVVSTNSGIQYATDEEIYIPVNSTECTVQCTAVTSGVGSKVIENTLTTIQTNTGHNLSCTNESGSSGGTDEYTDSQYRELLKGWRLIYLKGSKEAFENYFARFDGIDGYKLVPNWNGTGTVKIILDPGTEYQLNQAYNEIKENVCQYDTDITMFSPNKKYIDVYATVNVDIDQVNPYSASEKEQIQSKIVSAIKIFIDGGYTNDGYYYIGLELGEDFIPHKLAVFLDEEIPELKNIQFSYPEDYVQILDEEIGVSNDIVIEMV